MPMKTTGTPAVTRSCVCPMKIVAQPSFAKSVKNFCFRSYNSWALPTLKNWSA